MVDGSAGCGRGGGSSPRRRTHRCHPPGAGPHPHAGDVAERLATADLVWFGGGDASAIYDRLWATPALDAIRVAHEGGAVVAGVSAGAIVWGRGTLSDYASLGEREPFPLFGWLSDLVVFAHYGPARERAFRHLVASFPGCGGLAVTHGGVVVVGAGGRDLTVLREGSTGTPHLLLGGAEAPLLPVGD